MTTLHPLSFSRRLAGQYHLPGLLAILIVMVWATPPATASSVRVMDLDELVALSDRIVHARCVGTRAEWVNEKIFTLASFEIIEPLRGSNESLTVTALGGTAVHPVLNAPVTMQVSGAATFRVGEEVVLFTARNRLGQDQVVGLSLGKYRVRVDPDTGEKRVASGMKDLLAAPRRTDGRIETLIETQDMTLQNFLDRVRGALRRDGQANTP